MAWVNFHSHSHYCDGKNPIEDHVIKAIQLGIGSLGLSSHAPVPFECSWSMKRDNLGKYIAEIKQLNNKYSTLINLYKGLEIDYIPGQVTPGDDIFQNADLDYRIGSIHFVGQFEDKTNWAIDGPGSSFVQGLDQIYHSDIKTAVKKYYMLIRKMIEEDCPEIIGHMDKIKMHSPNGKYFREEEPWYRNEVMHTLECIRDNDVIMEVNTRGIYKKKNIEPYPSPWILKEAFDMDIPVLLNSDSHTPDELINEFENTAKLLISIGFREERILTPNGWQDMPFNEKGLTI